MKPKIYLTILILIISICGNLNAQVQMNFEFDTPYGNNKDVGKYVNLNGAKIYYEDYGTGEPMLLIHGNTASINAMGNQIDYFKNKYRVIIADNRGHGKSELKTDSLTYKQIAKDWEALANHLKLDSFYIVGWSDGGIVGLLMGINHKSKVKKIVAMGANLRPDSSAIYSWAVKDVQKQNKFINSKIKEKDTSENWYLQKQIVGLLVNQPNITVSELLGINVPVLVIAGDKDIIRGEHTLEIFKNIPKSQLCIMPGETHFAPASNPKLFNRIVEKFITKPFKRPNSDWTKWDK